MRSVTLWLGAGAFLVTGYLAAAGADVARPGRGLESSPPPPLTFEPGSDHARAQALGFASPWTPGGREEAYALTFSAPSGARLTIDALGRVRADPLVASYQLEVASPLRGTLTTPAELKIRLWTGDEAPHADDAAGVCAVLDLLNPAGTRSVGACPGSAQLQVEIALPGDSAGMGHVDFRPADLRLH